jgi:hypothetical protein
LHFGRHLNARQCFRQPIGAALAGQHLCLHQRLDALLQEKGVTLRPLDQLLRERPETGIVAQQCLEECLGALARQRVEPQLGIEGLVTPAVPVLWAVGDQEEHAHRR